MDFGSGARLHLWFKESFQIEELGSSSENLDIGLIVFLVARWFCKDSGWDVLGVLIF